MRSNFRSSHQVADDQYIRVKTATILAGGTQSDAVALDGLSPIRVLWPGGWKSTAPVARVLVSEDNVTYYRLRTPTGTAYTIPAVKSTATQLADDAFHGLTYLKLSSTTAKGTSVTQPAVAVQLVCRLL